MTKSELYLPDTAFIGPGLLFLNQYFNSFIDEYIVLWIAMVSESNSRVVVSALKGVIQMMQQHLAKSSDLFQHTGYFIDQMSSKQCKHAHKQTICV